MPIPVAERSKARVCGRSLAGVASSIPLGAWMFVLCLLQGKGKRHSQDNQEKEEVQMKKGKPKKKKSPARGMDFMLCVSYSKDIKAKASTIRTKIYG